MIEYVRDGAEIYRRSFATIRAEADLAGLPADVAQVAVRMIHACGMVDLVERPRVLPRRGDRRPQGAARAARRSCATHRWSPSGITRKRLPADNEVLCTLRDPRVPGAGRASSAPPAARPRWSCGATGSAGAVVAIGNAPTALFRLLELIEAGAPRPAAVLGHPGRVHRRGRVQGGPRRAPERSSTWSCTAGAAAAR